MQTAEKGIWSRMQPAEAIVARNSTAIDSKDSTLDTDGTGWFINLNLAMFEVIKIRNSRNDDGLPSPDKSKDFGFWILGALQPTDTYCNIISYLERGARSRPLIRFASSFGSLGGPQLVVVRSKLFYCCCDERRL